MKNSLLLKLSLSISVILYSVIVSLACSCVWEVPNHFCRSVDESDYIILAEVTDRSDWFAMDVKIIDNINLQTDSDTITILGQDGFNCGEWLEDFLVGDTLVLALENGEFYEVMSNETYNWFLGNCGLYYLRYTDGMILGDIDFDEESISYDDFSEGVMDCMDLSSSTYDFIAVNDLILSPNPTSDYLNISIESTRGGFYFDIINVAGNVIQSNIFINAPNKRVDLSHISAGIYFLRSKNTSEVVTKKFIKI